MNNIKYEIKKLEDGWAICWYSDRNNKWNITRQGYKTKDLASMNKKILESRRKDE